MERAKRGPGKDGCQLFLQSLHLRLLGASLHPALPPRSSAAAQDLLQQRKAPLMVQTERSVCVLRTESLSLQTVHESTLHLPCPRSFSAFSRSPAKWFSFSSSIVFYSPFKPPLSILDSCCHSGLFGSAFMITFNWLGVRCRRGPLWGDEWTPQANFWSAKLWSRKNLDRFEFIKNWGELMNKALINGLYWWIYFKSHHCM